MLFENLTGYNRVQEYDDFLSENEAIEFWHHVHSCTWAYGHVSNSYAGQKQMRMTHSINPEEFVKTSLFKRIQYEIEKPIFLKDVYINIGDFGTINLPHTDGYEGGISILINLNEDWSRDWAGHTVFFEGSSSNKNKIVLASCPEPRKAVFFHSSICHHATPIASFAKYNRFMLVIKTYHENKEDDL